MVTQQYVNYVAWLHNQPLWQLDYCRFLGQALQDPVLKNAVEKFKL